MPTKYVKNEDEKCDEMMRGGWRYYCRIEDDDDDDDYQVFDS